MNAELNNNSNNNQKHSKRIVMGLSAHVDAGKTTLCEAFLKEAGVLKVAGRVDKGDAFLDWDLQERKRGITAFSKPARLTWGNTELTLMDTPGHSELYAEAERVFPLLDYALIVVSAAEGLRSHTLQLWRRLRELAVPCFVFITKCDSPNADADGIMVELQRECASVFDFKYFNLNNLNNNLEDLACLDDELTAEYLETSDISKESLQKAFACGSLTPVFRGSGLKEEGIREFLDAIDFFCDEKLCFNRQKGDALKLWKVTADAKGGSLSWFKLDRGTVALRQDTPVGKITDIRLYSGESYERADELGPGSICALKGLEVEAVRSGDLICPTRWRIKAEGMDDRQFLSLVKEVMQEHPYLDMVADENNNITVALMGEVQREIIAGIFKERYGLDVEFDSGTVAYKETVKTAVEGAGHFEPLRHYAEVHLRLEPLERGRGVEIISRCSEDSLDKNWQRLIISELEQARLTGVLTCSPVTDMRIVLIAGKAHTKHTSGGDFREASLRAFRNALMYGESALLEPASAFSIRVPSDRTGRVMTDLRRLGMESEPPEQLPEYALIKGIGPTVLLNEYLQEFTSFAGDRGLMELMPAGCIEAHNREEIIKDIGYEPLKDRLNPASSVFCSSGESSVVPWNEVKDRCHIKFNNRKASAGVVKYNRGNEDLDKLIRELFGDTSNTPVLNSRTKNNNTEKKFNAGKKRLKSDLLIVDGYNMLFAWEQFKELIEVDMALARDNLKELMANYAGFRNTDVILVFDGYKVKDNPGDDGEYRGIRIIYTREGETADSRIEAMLREYTKGYELKVASSDALIQVSALSGGFLRMSNRELEQEVIMMQDRLEQALAELNRRNGRLHNYVL